jgi:poly-gamma-glutamate synthesis protein (capsule biosynthesis protein)
MLRYKRLAATVVITAIVIIVFVSVKNQSIMRFFRREAVISVAGDILLDRGVANAIDKNGMNYPYRGVARLFDQDDITIANLECPLTKSNGGAMKAKRFVFKAHPDNALAMKSAGFDVLMLANNHTMDYLSRGLADTMETLGDSGLLYAGAGLSKAEIQPCFINKNGVRVGILSYSSLPPEGFMHDGDRATVAYAREGFLDSMRNDITDAAEQCDFLIVYFHWGIEYRHDVSDAQIEIAHAAVDSGASAVVGTHPHVLQGRETYNGAPIYYSIGNFVFDKQIPEGTDEALIVQFTVSKNGIVAISELPVVIRDCQPLIADGQKASDIETNMIRYSRRFEPLLIPEF